MNHYQYHYSNFSYLSWYLPQYQYVTSMHDREIHMSLNMININAGNFDQTLMIELLKNRGVILEGLGVAFSQNVEALFKAFDVFRELPDAEKALFRGMKNTLHGYFPQADYHYGAKTTERFFIGRDAEKNLVAPLPNNNFDLSSKQLINDIQNIATRIIAAIETGLHIEAGKLARLMNPSSLISMSHYLPTTQELLNAMLEEQKLTVTDMGEIKTFEEHKDLSLFSILIYRNNCSDGLRIKLPNGAGKSQYHSIDLDSDGQRDQTRLIIQIGCMLQQLTERKLLGLKHTVVTKPLQVGETFSRECIGVFMSHDSSLDLYPLIGADQTTPISFQAMFEARKLKYDTFCAETALTTLPPLAHTFPHQADIAALKTQQGVVYRRIH